MLRIVSSDFEVPMKYISSWPLLRSDLTTHAVGASAFFETRKMEQPAYRLTGEPISSTPHVYSNFIIHVVVSLVLLRGGDTTTIIFDSHFTGLPTKLHATSASSLLFARRKMRTHSTNAKPTTLEETPLPKAYAIVQELLARSVRIRRRHE